MPREPAAPAQVAPEPARGPDLIASPGSTRRTDLAHVPTHRPDVDPVGFPQAPLRVSSPDESAEREADRAAERVMMGESVRIAAAPSAPAAACDPVGVTEKGQADRHEVRRKGPADALPMAQGAPPAVAAALAGPGRPIDPATRAYFEPRFGTSFADVRLYTDEAAASAARTIGAHAFTLGRRIGFAAGRHDPASPAGRRLLAHELAHAAQTGSAGRGDVIFRSWDARAEDTLRDFPGVTICVRRWPLPAYRGTPTIDRWVGKVEYFAPLNFARSYGIAAEFWATVTFPAGTAVNVALIVSGAHAAAWESARMAFPANAPSRPTPAQVFGWFRRRFEAEIRSGLQVNGISGVISTVTIAEDPPPGCPCP